MLLQYRMHRALTGLAVALLALGAAAQAPLPEGVRLHRDLKVQEMSIVIAPPPRAGGDEQEAWSREFAMPTARYLRLHFDQLQVPGGADFELRVLGVPSGALVASYGASAFAGRTRFTTGLLPTQGVRAVLVTRVVPAGLRLRLAHFAAQAPRQAAHAESAVAQGDPMAALPATDSLRKLAGSVALLHVGPDGVACTGFLVDERTLLTNHHCIDQSLEFREADSRTPGPCGDVLVEFDYLRAGQRGATAVCEQVLGADAERDVAWLRLRPPPTAAGEPRQPIALASTAVAPGRVSVIEHPVGEPMWAVECRVRSATDKTLMHDCWTERGSSGSPMLGADGALVGLHFRGAYPVEWTGEQREADFRSNGPRYNQARSVGALGPKP